MRKRLNLPLRVLIIIVSFVVGQTLFIAGSCLPNIMRTTAAQQRSAGTLVERYLAGNLPESLTGQNMKALFYTVDGLPIREIDSIVTPPSYTCEKATRRYFASGKLTPVATAVVVKESNTGSLDERIDIVAYIVEPIVVNGETTGALVLLKDMVTVTFFIEDSFKSFSLIYLVILTCGIIVSRKKRSLEQLRQNYIDNITHELKSPIASIKALTTALNDHELDQKTQSEYYGLIMSEANRQEQMVQNILELSRIQGHGMDFKKTRISARELFEPICQRYESLCDDLDIVWHASDELFTLPTLCTNADCIRRLLDVLLGNAFKFTRERGEIWLEAEPGSGCVTICVRDNGVGIAKSALPHIFERFFRGESNYNKSGNGLGLAIAKEIVNGLHEKIWVESEDGKGAAFFFTIHTHWDQKQ